MARENGRSKRPCCMVSEVLEEAGLDREHVRTLRRQVLQGMILMCQWQLERMNETDQAAATTRPPRVRKVKVE